MQERARGRAAVMAWSGHIKVRCRVTVGLDIIAQGDVHGVMASRDGANTRAGAGQFWVITLGVETPPKISWASPGLMVVKVMRGCKSTSPSGS